MATRLRPVAAPTALAAVALAAVFGCQRGSIEPLTTLREELAGAVWQVERSKVDFGRPEAHPAMTSGWGQDEGQGDGTFVWSIGEQSTLSLFLIRPRPLRLTLHARPAPFPGLGPQVISISANGVPIDEWRMEGPDDLYSVALPADALTSGTNRISFRYRWTRSPAEMTSGSTDVRPLAVQWIDLRIADAEADADETAHEAGGAASPRRLSPRAADPGDGLWLPPASRTVFHLSVPSRASLEIEVLEGDGPVEVDVQRRSGGDGARLRLAAGQPPASIPLSDRADDMVRIGVSAVAPTGGEARPVRIRGRVHGWVSAPGASDRGTHAAGAAGTRSAPGAERPNVVLYITDTLRADRLGVYGYPRPTTPRLDAFARTAIVFDRALAQAPYTRPSTASILTGLSPSAHRVLGIEDVLPSEALTLAEILKGEGYETAAFVANGNVIEAFGFAEGFDHFEDLTAPLETRARGFELHAGHADRAAHPFVAPLNEYVFDWLEHRKSERPLLLYVHAVEPHSPYNPPEPYRERFAPGVGSDLESLDAETREVIQRLQASFIEQGVPQAQRGIGSRAWLHALAAGAIEPTDRVLADLSALYDAEVAFADAAFGSLLDELDRRRLLASSAVLFLSDHGEEFFEHGAWEHGKTLHSEVLRVPMILRLPDGSPWGQKGLRVADLARHIDVLPTLLDVVGIPLPGEMDGRSLASAFRGDSLTDVPSFAFVDLNGHVGASIDHGDWKLIEALRPAARVSLYARADSTEQRDLAASDPILAGWLASRIRLEIARGRARDLDPKTTPIEPEVEARLRAMGYVE